MVELENPSIPVLLTAIVSIVLSSVYYTWVWYKPDGFIRLVRPLDACQAMAVLANILKTIQYVAIAYLTNWSVVASRCLTLQYALPGLLLLAFGQHLNAAVYRVLGVNGVYYGARFGKSIPWVKGYPYDRFRDPQYLGCIASLAGAYIIGFPQELILWWFSNYLYLMWLESRVPGAVTVVG